MFGSNYRRALRRTTPFIWASAAVLLGISAAVWLWVLLSPEAEAGLLPPMVREAVRRGTGSPGTADPSVLSAAILTNNVGVAFIAFALGVGFGVGTVYVLGVNGVMIGSIAGAAQNAGTAGRFWALVLPHGFLEIVAICIAAGAGLRMGWALVDPGNRTRGGALVEEARDSVLVVLGVVPAFIVAAVIEGFLTGSVVPSGLQIASGAAVAIGYLVFLAGGPRKEHRDTDIHRDREVRSTAPSQSRP